MTYRNDTETINELRAELSAAYKKIECAQDEKVVAYRDLERAKMEKWEAYFHAGLTFVVATVLAVVAWSTVQGVNSWAPLSAKARVQGDEFCEALEKQDREAQQ